ncbi:MAG: zf-HC2 domain-containing protein [Acidobacteria bacterium]|nr:zf-HC2 domain-containing protein [Acidobacteriota bacterium]
MVRCEDVDRLMTPFVDGEIADADRAAVEAHLERCTPCRMRSTMEAAARQVLRSGAASLREAATVQAPLDLKARCAAAARTGSREAARSGIRQRRGMMSWRLAAAAAVVLAVGGVVGLVLSRTSTTVMAAQLTVDHLKCSKLFPPNSPSDDVRVVEQRVGEQCGWPVRVAGSHPAIGLKLLGARRCLFGDGHVAHVMYLQGNEPVSLFVIPGRQSDPRALSVFGHRARVWSRDGRTYVLVGRQDEARLGQVAQYAQSMTH